MPQLALTVQRVDRHEHRAEPRAGEKYVEEWRAVRELHAEPVAAAKPARRDLGGHPVSAGVHLAEGEGDDRARVVEKLQPHAVRASAERDVEELG